MDGRVGAGALVDQNSLEKTWTAPRNLTFYLILLALSEANGGGGVEVGFGVGGRCGSPWQMSNFITEPCMHVVHTLLTALHHAAIIWSFGETEVLDCNLWAISLKSCPWLRWWHQPPRAGVHI